MEKLDPGMMRITVKGPQVAVFITTEDGDEVEARLDPQTALAAAQGFMACAARARANEIAEGMGAE